MRIFSFFVLVLISTSVSCQLNLKKYSYQIFGYEISGKYVSVPTGTGFFIKQNKRLFFITALHVVSGCIDSIKPKLFPKEMEIMIKNESDTTIGTWPVPVEDLFNTTKCDSIDFAPDFHVFEISNKIIDKVFSVEGFIVPAVESERCVIYGYPATNIVRPSPGEFIFQPASNVDFPVTNSGITLCEYLDIRQPYNYMIKNIMGTTTNMHGYSGAPVFLFEKKTTRCRVIGLLVASDNNGNYIIVCKIEDVFAKIKELLSNN